MDPITPPPLMPSGDVQKPGRVVPLPHDIIGLILEKVAESLPPHDAAKTLAKIKLVSKGWREGSDRAITRWINNNRIPLEVFGLSSQIQTLKFVKKHHLTSVNLEGVRFLWWAQENLPILIAAYPNLIHLNLTDKLIADEHIAKLPGTLRSLNISFCHQLTKTCLPGLPEQLEELDLSFSQWVTDECIDMLPEHLISLNLGECRELSPAFVDKLPKNIRELNLDGLPSLTDEGVSKLPRGIIVLNLNHTRLTNACIPNLPPNLEKLSLRTCFGLREMFTMDLPATLKELDLSQNLENIGNETIAHLQHLELTHLNLTDNVFVTDEGINRLPQTLKVLNISQNRYITTAGYQSLPEGIVELNVDCTGLKNQDIKVIVERLKHLRILDLSYNQDLTDDCLQYLPETLRYLAIRGVGTITEEALIRLQERIPNLIVERNRL